MSTFSAEAQERLECAATAPTIIGAATLIRGDCITEMAKMPPSSIDAIVCDPPYELGFMGKAWDASGIANNVDMWREALRVLKPGGHLLAFSGSRTYHRMTCAIEDAGFDIRDQIMWIYGSGFPKSLDVGKAIDKTAGAQREVLSEGKAVKRMIPGADQDKTGSWIKDNGRQYVPTVTAAATEAAAQWDGWGTALKPAHEPICVARKPLVGTVAANVLTHGTGALNIAACRIEVTDTAYARNCSGDRGHAGTRSTEQEGATNLHTGGGSAAAGRWPANLIHDGSDEALAAFPDAKGQQGRVTGNEPTANGFSGAVQFGGMLGRIAPAQPRVEIETSAARFFYCAKASPADRHEGLPYPGPQFQRGSTLRDAENLGAERKGNHHPTVKPTDLMGYLCRLVTPPGGLVLDPFMGSGSTGKAALREGFRFIGIELDESYMEIARARIEFEIEAVGRGAAQAAEAQRIAAQQRTIFELDGI